MSAKVVGIKAASRSRQQHEQGKGNAGKGADGAGAIGEGDAELTDFPDWVVKTIKKDIGGPLPEGFPYIRDQISGDVCQVALLHMSDRHLRLSGSFVINTVASYTRDQLDWMRYCSRFAIPWSKATWADLGRYVDSLEGDLVSPHHGEHYKEATVTRRLVPIVDLYAWAVEEKLEGALLDVPQGTLFEPKNVAKFLDDRRKQLRSHVKAGKDSVADADLRNVMQPHEVKDVLAAMGPPPRKPRVSTPEGELTWGEGEASEESSVAHLGMELGVQAGLRVGEVCDLKVGLFERFYNATIHEGALYRVGPIRRKGGKWKFVKFHGVLLQKVLDYIRCERRSVMNGRGDHGFLLVHKTPQYRGQRVHKSTLQRRFTQACVSAQLTRPVTKALPVDGDWSKTGKHVVQRACYVFHDLRHTYAVWMYYARKDSGDPEPWKFIQEQLGHEDVLTTIKTYLKVTQDFEAMVTDHFVSTLNTVAGILPGEEEGA